MQFHKYTLHDIEYMLPWEREIYIELLNQHLNEKKKKNQNG